MYVIAREYFHSISNHSEENASELPENLEKYLQDFVVILKHSLQNYQKILKIYFIGTDNGADHGHTIVWNLSSKPLRKSQITVHVHGPNTYL